MLRQIIARTGQLVPTLFVASIVIFLVIAASPGDPARMRLGREATEAQLSRERERLGLDEPLPVRYVVWLTDAVQLDLGRSIKNNQPVTTIIVSSFTLTIRLAVAAFLVGLILGPIMGIVAALFRGRAVDVAISALSAVLLSLPSFIMGALLILVFGVMLGWLPPSGVGRTGQSPIEGLRYLILPALALGLPFAAVMTRFTRSALIEALSEDYVRTARAKGLTSYTVVVRHALRNALIPMVTIAGIWFGALLAGSIVTETVFAYPGLGRTIVGAIQGRDYAVVQGGLLLAGFLLLVMSLIVDLTYALLDPRIRVR